MKKLFILLSITFILYSCKNDYNKGNPVIIKKEQSLYPGKCIYTYEGYGIREWFDDDCDKYSVGDTLGK
jgi:hypothetical protein